MKTLCGKLFQNSIHNMTLYTLNYGKSKKRMKPIMVDSYKKCENYMKARKNVNGFHEILIADKNATMWKQKTCTIGGNRDSGIVRITRHGEQRNGWISKQGFQQHT